MQTHLYINATGVSENENGTNIFCILYVTYLLMFYNQNIPMQMTSWQKYSACARNIAAMPAYMCHTIRVKYIFPTSSLYYVDIWNKF